MQYVSVQTSQKNVAEKNRLTMKEMLNAIHLHGLLDFEVLHFLVGCLKYLVQSLLLW